MFNDCPIESRENGGNNLYSTGMTFGGGGLQKSNFSTPPSVHFHKYPLYSIFKLKTGNFENILKADEPGRRLRFKGLS